MSFIITARNPAGEIYFYPASGRWTKESDKAAIYDDKAEVDRVSAQLQHQWKGLTLKVEPSAKVPGVQLKLSALSEGLRQEVKKHMKEGKAKLSAMPTDLKERILKETGEWDNSDEGMVAWKEQLRTDILDIIDAVGTRMELVSVHGFDVYQGPYAWVKIDGKPYKVWTQDGDLWIEKYKVDNTSMHDKLPGFQGTPDEIAHMLSTDHMMSSEFGLNELRNEISGAIKEGLGGTMPAETKSLWAVLGIKDMKELPQSPALPEIMQMLHDNGITGPFKYGRFGTDGLIYIMGNGGKIGIGLHNGKLEALSAGMLWDL